MRVLQAVAVVVLLALLSAIAWELHQLRVEFAPVAALTYASELATVRRSQETPDQRRERVQREQQQLESDLTSILSAPRVSPTRRPK
jgi:hypothetical protein